MNTPAGWIILDPPPRMVPGVERGTIVNVDPITVTPPATAITGMTLHPTEVDVVVCDECHVSVDDVATCEMCDERGCACLVAPDMSCTTFGGLVCADHTENHRGCPTCDPPDPYDD